jgi:hypothetical protein
LRDDVFEQSQDQHTPPRQAARQRCGTTARSRASRRRRESTPWRIWLGGVPERERPQTGQAERPADLTDPPWALIAFFARGRLLAPPMIS